MWRIHWRVGAAAPAEVRSAPLQASRTPQRELFAVQILCTFRPMSYPHIYAVVINRISGISSKMIVNSGSRILKKSNMTDQIFFDGVRHVSAGEAASSLGLTRDYIARLCKEGKLSGTRVGKQWYVSDASVKTFAINQEYSHAKRSEDLAKARKLEYQVGPVQKDPVHSLARGASLRDTYVLEALESAAYGEKLHRSRAASTAAPKAP